MVIASSLCSRYELFDERCKFKINLAGMSLRDMDVISCIDYML